VLRPPIAFRALAPRWRRSILPWLAVGICVSSLLAGWGVPTAGPRTAPPVRSEGARAPSPAAPRPHVPASSPSIYASALLFNETLLAGDYGVGDVVKPDQVASGNGTTEYVGSKNSAWVAVLSGTPPVIRGMLFTGAASVSGLLFDPSTGDLYVLHYGCNGNLTVVHVRTGQIVASIGALCYPMAAALEPSNGDVYVSNFGSVSVLNASTRSVVTTINGPIGYGIAYASASQQLFLANAGSGNVSVVDAKTNTVVKWGIPMGANGCFPYDVVYDNVTNEVYVANLDVSAYGQGNLTVINASSDQITHWISVYNNSTHPWGLAYSAASRTVFFSSSEEKSLGAVSDRTHAQYRTIDVTAYPEFLDVNTADGLLFDPQPGASNHVVYLNDTSNATVRGTVTVGAQPNNFAEDPRDHRLFVVDYSGSNLEVLNDSTLGFEQMVQVGSATSTWIGEQDPLRGILYDPVNDRLYVANPDQVNVSVLNASSLAWVANISIGYQPDLFSLDAQSNLIFVSNMENLTEISGTTNTAIGWKSPWPFYAQPEGVVYDPANNTLYVALNSLNQVDAWNLTTGSVTNISVKAGPTTLALDEGRSRLYVACSARTLISVINTTSNLAINNYTVSAAPQNLVVDPATGRLWVSEPSRNEVVLLNLTGGTLLTLTVGQYPVGLVELGSWSRLAIAARDSGSVSVLDTVYNVTANETGLPAGQNWSLTLGNATYRSSGASITTELPNGSFGFQVFPSRLWSPQPDQGNLSVNGTAANLSIRFLPPPRYNVTFSESGLPNGTSWSVSVNGTTTTGNGSLRVSLTNGSYSFAVGGVAGYTSHPPTGALEVNGSDQNVSLAFLPVPRYPVDFTEGGLPSGTNWSLTVNGSAYGGTATVHALSLTNGTYNFSVANASGYAARPAQGSFQVNGTGTNVTLSFDLLYPVKFQETGLPNSTTWTVDVNGTKLSARSSLVEFNETNGTYRYSVTPIPGFTTDWTGTVTVSGGTAWVNLTLTRVRYDLDFSETGLPNGTPWSVTIDGLLENSTGVTIPFSLPNGTYAWAVTPVPGFETTRTGTVTVNGSAKTVPLSFTVFTYALTFVETGLPSGTPWTVNLGGTPQTSVSNVIHDSEPNGTYSWSIRPIAGYSTNWSGVALVAGGPASVAVTFRLFTYQVTFSESGLPAGTDWSVRIGSQLESSTGSSVLLLEPNGSFAYSILPIGGWATAGSRGTVNVSAGDALVSVAWLRFTYAVTFMEHALPAGTTWWVNVSGGASTSSSTGSILLRLPNGTFDFSVATADKGYASPGASVSVANASTQVAVDFARVTYAVVFQSGGLPAESPWSVTLTGNGVSGTGCPATGRCSADGVGSLSFAAPNGTYQYSLGEVPGWTTAEFAGILTVHGGAADRTVNWTRVTYQLTFWESGLGLGTTWSVNLTSASTGAAIAIEHGVAGPGSGSIAFPALPNGSYAYSVPGVAGYSLTPSTGVVEINGSSRSWALSFTAPGPGGWSPTLGLPVAAAIGVWVALAVAIVGLAFVAFRLRQRERICRRETDAAPEAEPGGDPPP
jgi:YVTN family beta-propeller protein